jgi:hypothetical protein
MLKHSPGYVANRARISLALSRFTVPLLSRIYGAFEGDMIAALVLGEIAHRNVEAWLSDPANAEEALQQPEQREQLMRPCNALSIAEACKLPRETVRRKVVQLITQGYIYRNERGHLYLTHSVGDDFEDMTAQTVEQLLSTAATLQGLIEDQPVVVPTLPDA